MKLHWAARVAIYFCLATLIGSYYDNWTSTEKYLVASRVYSFKCPHVKLSEVGKETLGCEAQQLAVANLLTVTRIAELVSSVFIGIFMDWTGPRVTCILGILLRGLSYILLGFFATNGAAAVSSMLLAGLSNNFVFFPTLTAALHIPWYSSEVTIVIGMSSSFAGFIIKAQYELLNKGFLSNVQLCSILTFGILPLCLVLAILSMPMKLPEMVHREALGDGFKKSASSGQRQSSSIEGIVVVAAKSQDEDPTGKDVDDTNVAAATVKMSSARSCSHEQPPLLDTCKWTWRGLVRVLKSFQVIVCLVYYPLNFASVTLLQQSLTIVYHDVPTVLEASEYTLPLSFLACLSFVGLYRVTSALFIIVLLNTVALLAHFFIIFKSLSSGLIASALISVAYSVFNTKVYNYLSNILSSTYFGSVIGLINSLAGLVVVAYTFLVDLSLAKIHYPNYTSIAIRFCFFVPFSILLLSPTYWSRLPSASSFGGDDGRSVEEMVVVAPPQVKEGN